MELWKVIMPKPEGFKLNLKLLNGICVMPSLPGHEEETKQLYLHNSSARGSIFLGDTFQDYGFGLTSNVPVNTAVSSDFHPSFEHYFPYQN